MVVYRQTFIMACLNYLFLINKVKRFSFIILVFSIVFLVLLLSPAFLKQPVSFYPLMSLGDLLDVITPLMLIPLYWLLYRFDENKMPRLKEIMAFLLFAALWVEGQGMHLSANSIGHLLEEMKISDAYKLTHFYDEILSHYLWHSGVIGLSALLILKQWRNPFKRDANHHGY